MPKRPYITDGTAASSSTAAATIDANALLAISVKKTAVNKAIGTAISTDKQVASNEVKIIYCTP